MDSSELPKSRISPHLSDGLSRLVESTAAIPELNLEEVDPGDILLFVTKNSLYRFVVENPANSRDQSLCGGEVQGGRFKGPTKGVTILGSTLTRGALIGNQAKQNMCLQFRVPLEKPDENGVGSKVVTTSTLQSIKKLPAASIVS